MTLVRFNPWAELDAVTGDFDRFFNRVATRPVASPITVQTDVHEDEAGYTLDIDVPGVKLEDIDISLHDGLLTISGERKSVRKDGESGYRRVERRFGTFSRSFRLPKHVDDAGIEASAADGVLHISLPKKEEVKPRTIAINGKA